MRRRPLPLLALLSLLAGALPAAQREPLPRLETADGWLQIAGLPGILDDPEVASQLGSGLTTTFLFRTDLPGEGVRSTGAAQVEIRYELWDEVFHVVAAGLGGEIQRHALASREALLAWWRDLALPLLPTDRLDGAAREARVVLEVVPFSRSEQDETRRWLADGAEVSPEGYSESPDDRGGSLERVFSVLIATSIQRRALISYRWTLELPGPNE